MDQNRKTIFVVENNKLERNLIRDFLKKINYMSLNTLHQVVNVLGH
jgi:hypothetical protein